MKLINDEHQNGNIYSGTSFNGEEYCVFEDLQEENPRYYGWTGTWENHDNAQHIDFKSLEHAERFFELGGSS